LTDNLKAQQLNKLFSPLLEDFHFEAGVSTPDGLTEYRFYLKQMLVYNLSHIFSGSVKV